MVGRIDPRLLRELSKHTRKLGIKRVLQGMGYERSAELPLMASLLEPQFRDHLQYLDIGSGEGVFPSFILRKSEWDVTCVDKFAWVQRQHEYARRVMNGRGYDTRLNVLQQDFMAVELPPESFDVITNISVVEHFEGESDTTAMQKSARLLRPGGTYIVTTLVNDGSYREFFLNHDVYGEAYARKPVFFQRHYDVPALEERVLLPTGLQERQRTYFGEYGFQFYQNFMNIPWPLKPVKVLYQWATPFFARRFLTYRNYPISRKGAHMFTSSGVVVVLVKGR